MSGSSSIFPLSLLAPLKSVPWIIQPIKFPFNVASLKQQSIINLTFSSPNSITAPLLPAKLLPLRTPYVIGDLKVTSVKSFTPPYLTSSPITAFTLPPNLQPYKKMEENSPKNLTPEKLTSQHVFPASLLGSITTPVNLLKSTRCALKFSKLTLDISIFL